MFRSPFRIAAALSLVCLLPQGVSAASGDAALRAKIFDAYSAVHSYKITVLGSVKSSGVFVAPNRYAMSTEFDGKTVKTIFIGRSYWIFSNGHWQKSDDSSNTLDFDIEGLLRNARADKNGALVRLPDTTQAGKKVGAFKYSFKSGSSAGTDEVCNFDLKTSLVTRCKADELTILYAGYNDPSNKVGNPA
jgi:hypothetical protein